MAVARIKGRKLQIAWDEELGFCTGGPIPV